MPDNDSPVLSAAQHAVHNLKQYREGNMPFPGEALGILERFVGAIAAPAAIWPNGCDRTAPKALRYLASNTRPSGGESHYNSEHLLQIADELERAVKNSTLPVTPPAANPRAAMEALLANLSDADLFDILKNAGRASELPFRVPGTSRSHKVTCAVLEEADVAKVRRSLADKAT
jgi:hypothetical protein